jgi:hypothetical protein
LGQGRPVTEPAQRPAFDLASPLAGDADALGRLGQAARRAAIESEAHGDDFPLGGGKLADQGAQLVVEDMSGGDAVGRFVAGSEEIAQLEIAVTCGRG